MLMPPRAVPAGVSRRPFVRQRTAVSALLLVRGYRQRHFWNHEEVARHDGETEEKADFDLPRNDHLSKVILDPIGPRRLARVVVFGGHLVKCSAHLSLHHI